MIRKLATLAGALALLVGIPFVTLYLLGQAHSSTGGYALGSVCGLVLMALLGSLLNRVAEPFELEVSLTFAFVAGLAFAAWLALRGR